MKIETKKLSLAKIEVKGNTQPRQQTDSNVVHTYAVEIAAGTQFPPVTVFYDGKTYWLADGYHRYYAARANKHATIACEIKKGTQHDAMLYASGANAENGSIRTDEDKEFCIRRLLADEKGSQESSNWIAQKVRVDDEYVEKIRRRVSSENRVLKTPGSGHRNVGAEDRSQKRVGKDGRRYPATSTKSKPTTTPKKRRDPEPEIEEEVEVEIVEERPTPAATLATVLGLVDQLSEAQQFTVAMVLLDKLAGSELRLHALGKRTDELLKKIRKAS